MDNANDRDAKSDLLAEWLKLGREVLERYYPDAEYGLLTILIGEGVPAAQFPVTLPRSSSLAAGPSEVR